MIEQILNSKIFNALGWTLIHSLWQVAAVGILLALVLLILRKSTAGLRYSFSIAALLMSVVLFIGTFGFCYFSDNTEETQRIIYESDTALISNFIQNDARNITAGNENQLHITRFFYDYFNTHLPIIVTLWFLGLTLFVIRFLGGLAYIQRLKNRNNYPLNEEWEMVLNEVKTKLKVEKMVRLVESSLVNVPMVIGYLKPMILMPIGAINYLTIEEVEAIFAHELAHIKRYDYFVNLLQSIIETILFYHPAIWWISNEIRRERENCCDDLALEVTGNSLSLAKALAKVEQFRMNFVNPKIQLSMTALKDKNQLLQRIQRILNEPKSNPSNLKGLFASIILVFSFFVTSLDAQEKRTNPASNEAEKMETPVAPEANFPEVKKHRKPSEKNFPEAPKAAPNRTVPVSPTLPVFPIKSVAPAVPNTPVLPENPVKGLQPISPVSPIPPNGFTTFTFNDDDPKLVYVQLHNEKAVRRINTEFIDKIAVVKDTVIDEEIKEIILIKEIKEAGSAAKEVKISIKKINGKEEITIYENGRKLSEAEAKKYEEEINSNNTEMGMGIKNFEGSERHRRGEAEERLMLAEQRKALNEERSILRKERLKVEAEMKKSHAEMERLKEEQKNIYLEGERLRKEHLKKRKEQERLRKKLKSKESGGNTKTSSTSSTTTSTVTTTGAKVRTNDKWFDDFILILKKDGLLDKEAKEIRLKLSETTMHLNGKKMNEAQAKKYYHLYEELSETKINGDIEIYKTWKSF